MNNIKLFISAATLGAGGAERVISVLSTSFCDNFNDVRLLLWINRPFFYQVDPRVKIVDIETESGSQNLFVKMRWFRQYIKKENPNLLLSFLYPWSMKVIFSLLFAKVKIVVAERQDPRQVKGGQLTKIVRHILYLKTSGILVQTNENQKYYGGRLQKKVYTIYNPVIMDGNLVGKALASKKENIIVTVGRLDPAKNQKFLIETFASFHKLHPDYKLYIYGEGPLRNELESQIGHLGLNSTVVLKGNTPDVLSKIVTSKAFVLSSNYEGMPNALIEGMCLGLPCISTRVSGATELIDSGNNGLIIDIGNKKQLLEALESILNEKYAKVIAQNATHIYNITNKEFINKKWVDYIKKIIDN